MKIKKMGAIAVPVTLIALFMVACGNEKNETAAAEKTKSVTPMAADSGNASSKTVTNLRDYTLGTYTRSAHEPVKAISFSDSLMRLYIPEPPLLGKAEFNMAAHKDFKELAEKSGGSFIKVRTSKEVAGTAVKIIQKNLKKGTDVLFLIDQTGSMSDDIENIKKGMKDIVGAIKKQRDIRCGMAFYGDINEDMNWFRHTRFTYNFDTLENLIKDFTASGGGDLPESVYDGFFEAMNTMNTDDSRKLMVMIIGDAPSLDSTLATHSLQDVLTYCNKRDVHINLFPMLLATNDDDVEDITPIHADLIYALYPNPTRGEVHFKTNRAGFYQYEVINQAGSIVKTGSLNGPEATINISELSKGLYAIRLIDSESRHTESHKVVLQK